MPDDKFKQSCSRPKKKGCHTSTKPRNGILLPILRTKHKRWPRLCSPTDLGMSSYAHGNSLSASPLNDSYLASPRSPSVDRVQPGFLNNGGQLPSPTSPGAVPQSPRSPWLGSPRQQGNHSPSPKIEPDDAQRELGAKHEEEGSPVASDFVKKLYKCV